MDKDLDWCYMCKKNGELVDHFLGAFPLFEFSCLFSSKGRFVFCACHIWSLYDLVFYDALIWSLLGYDKEGVLDA